MNNAGLSQAQSDPLLPKKGDPDQQHPGSLFPAPTIAYPPSPTASSPSVRGNDDFGHSTNANIGFGEQMEGDGAREHRRRRSSLINGVASGNGQPRHQPRRTDEDTINEESKRHSSDDDDSDFSSHDTTEDVQLDDILAEEGLEDDEETGLTGNERKKRRSRKKRKMDLDERVAGELRLKKDMRKEADLSIIRQSLINGVLIGLWYIFSLSISLVNLPNLRATFTRMLTSTVQQMDVLERPPSFQLSSLHNLSAHACPVYARLPRPLPFSALPPSP